MYSTNLILVGPMGAGKTTIGRRLAKRMDRLFIDCDEELEKRTGVSISLIFELEGEAGFRERESRMLAELCEQRKLVLATGGGAILSAANRKLLRTSGFVVYLKTTVDEQLRRTQHDTHRPLLRTENPRMRLTQLAAQRNPLYEDVADFTIDTSSGFIKQLVKRIETAHECRGEGGA